MLKHILESGLKFAIVDGGLSVRGSAALVTEFRQLIVDWKPEIIKIVALETVDDAGACDHCNGTLIGLRTFDHYINRVCADCGTWHRCLPPPTPASSATIEFIKTSHQGVKSVSMKLGDSLNQAAQDHV